MHAGLCKMRREGRGEKEIKKGKSRLTLNIQALRHKYNRLVHFLDSLDTACRGGDLLRVRKQGAHPNYH